MGFVLPFFAGFQAAAVGAAGVGALTGAAAVGASFATFLTTTFAGRLLASVSLSALSAALQKKPKIQTQGIRGSQVTGGSVSPATILLGYYATNGNRNASPMSHGPNNKYQTYVIDVSDVPVDGLRRVSINGEWSDIGAAEHIDYGFPLLSKSKTTQTQQRVLVGVDHIDPRENVYETVTVYTNHARGWVRFYDGNQTAADPMLVAKYAAHPVNPWSADMVGIGVAYAIITLEFDRDVFQGVPTFRFELDGMHLYDPRKDVTVGGDGAHLWGDRSTWESSDNPMVQSYNILRGIELADGSVYGGGYDASRLPLSVWFAAMNECDLPVETDAGYEPQFRAGFEVSVDVDPAAILEELGKSCLARWLVDAGEIHVRCGPPGLPVLYVSDGDILTEMDTTRSPFPDIDDAFNGITATFPSPAAGWETAAVDAIHDAGLLADDAGQENVAVLDLTPVAYASQAFRIMSSSLNDSRRMLRHACGLGAAFMALQPLDVVAWTSDDHGYDGKTFELAQVTRQRETFNSAVVMREVDPSDFTPSVVAGGVSSTPVVVVTPPIELQNVQAQGGFVTDAQSAARRPKIDVSFDPADEITGLSWVLYPAGKQDIAGQGVSHNLSQATIVDGVLAGELYDLILTPIAQGPVLSVLVAGVQAPDIKLSTADIAADVLDSIADAKGVADTAAADIIAAQEQAESIQGDLEDLSDGVDAGFDSLRDQLVSNLGVPNSGFEFGTATQTGHPVNWLFRSAAANALDELQYCADADPDPSFSSGLSWGATDAVSGGPWWALGRRFHTEGGDDWSLSTKFQAVSGSEVSQLSDPTWVGEDDLLLETIWFDSEGTEIGRVVSESCLQRWSAQSGGAVPSERIFRAVPAFSRIAPVGAAFVEFWWVAVDADGAVVGDHAAYEVWAVGNAAVKLDNVDFRNTTGETREAANTFAWLYSEFYTVQEVNGIVAAKVTDYTAQIAGVNSTLTLGYYTKAATDQAIAASQQTLQANFDGLQATVTDDYLAAADLDAALASSITSVSADFQSLGDLVAASELSLQASQSVDGFSSAFAGLTAVTDGNGKIAGIKATSWSNPDGTGGGVLELLGDVIAEGTLATNKLVVGLGKNLLSNTDFSSGLTGWEVWETTGTQAAETSLGLRAPGLSWSGALFTVLELRQTGSAATGEFYVQYREFADSSGTTGVGVPITAGDWIEVSFKASMHRCKLDFSIRYYDASGVHLSYSQVFDAADGVVSDSTNPDLWPVYWGLDQAPVGAAYATIRLGKHATNPNRVNSVVFVHKPQLAVSHEAATQPAAFSPGGSTLITGSKILTGGVTAQDAIFENGAILNADIGDAQIDTLTLKGQAVTVPAVVQKHKTVNVTSSVPIEVARVVINREVGFQTAIEFIAQLDAYGNASLGFQVMRDGVLVQAGFGQVVGDLGRRKGISFGLLDQDESGGVTVYSVQSWKVSDSYVANGRVLKSMLRAVQTKR